MLFKPRDTQNISSSLVTLHNKVPILTLDYALTNINKKQKQKK